MRENFWQLEVSFFRWQLLFSVSRRKIQFLNCARLYLVQLNKMQLLTENSREVAVSHGSAQALIVKHKLMHHETE